MDGWVEISSLFFFLQSGGSDEMDTAYDYEQ
jgi:hypothetical protein